MVAKVVAHRHRPATMAPMTSIPASVTSLPPANARWLWTASGAETRYALFHRSWSPTKPAPTLRVRITAATTYELHVDGRFIGRGPVHGDPAWTCWDDYTVMRHDPQAPVEIAVVVHNAGPDARVSAVIPAPGGFAAEFIAGDEVVVTDARWAGIPLRQWQPTGKRGWALGFGEDYDARLEPAGWAGKRFDSTAWPRALEIADIPWTGHSPRPVPDLALGIAVPVAWTTAKTSSDMPTFERASIHADEEPLHDLAPAADFAAVNAALAAGANVVTADLGAEFVGHYEIEIDAPAGTVIDIAGAELLRDGRPWIHRKGTSYTARYTAAGGRAIFRTFAWSGFRWLHVVVRAGGPVRLHALRAATRSPRLPLARIPRSSTPQLSKIEALCRRTLAVGVQEHLIDCPSREQAQYWGDGVFIAQALSAGFGEPAYLRFYLDAFINVPFTAEGQISSVYPGRHVSLLDYSLIPLIGQRFHRDAQGCWHRAAETLAKARALKRWYDARRDADGLLRQLHDLTAQPPLITFIDHPGIGWHDFPHGGISRAGRSAGLNLFFLLFIRTMADIASDLGAADASALREQERQLAQKIRAVFFADGVVHDAERDGKPSPESSWQINALAVLAGILSAAEATATMRAMLAGYDRLCRCSPYFHFYFLPALRRAGLTAEAMALIEREWGPMIAAGATTTWEGFLGDVKDTLCHPWSTAPYLFLLEVEAGDNSAWPS